MDVFALEKRALQCIVAVAATLPVVAGTWDVVHHVAGATSWSVNHGRYLSGLLLAIGLGFWSAVPNLEVKTARIRLLTFIVVIGGLCRLLGVIIGDALTPSVAGALVMELVVTPSLCLWQARFSHPEREIVTLSPQFDS